MMKSTTAGQRIHKWARKLSSSSLNSTGNETSKLRNRHCKNEEELLQKYYAEEDEFLSEIEQIRKSLTSPTDSAATSAGVAPVTWSIGEEEVNNPNSNKSSLLRPRSPGVIMTGSRVSRKLARLQQRKQALLASFTGECINPHTDLLGSFCHLMNYVVHLRRDNRRLRKQVTCLAEMRKIEQLKFELLHSNCTCRSTHTNNEAPLDPSAHKSDESAMPCEPGNQTNHQMGAHDNVELRLTRPSSLIKVHSPPPSFEQDKDLETTHPSLNPRLSLTPTSSATCTRREMASLSIRVTQADSSNCSTTTTNTQSSNTSIASTMKSTKIPKPKITPCRLEVPRTHGNSSEIRDGAQECLATPPPPATPTNFHQKDRMVASSCSADMSSAASSTAHPSPRANRSFKYGFPSPNMDVKEHRRNNGLNSRTSTQTRTDMSKSRRGSDSEQSDQVFSEVCFPGQNDSPVQPRGRQSVMRRSSNQPDQIRTDSSQPVSPTQSNSSQISLMDRLGGIRKRLAASMSRSDYVDRRANSVDANNLIDRNDGAHTSQSTMVGAVRKAFVKKRKRKISESDSVASSDTGGMPYKVLELPTNIPPSPSSYHQTSDAMLTAMHSSLTPEYIRKMTEWQQKRMRRATSSADRRAVQLLPRIDRTMESSRFNTNSEEKTAVATLPRIKEPSEENDVTDVSHRRSVSMNSDVDKSQSNNIGNRARKPRDHQDDQSSFLSSNPSLNVSRFSVSDDSVFVTADQATVGGGVEGSSIVDDHSQSANGSVLLNQVVTLQDKNSALFRQLIDKTSQYEKITEQLTMLEKQVRVLKGQYNLDSTIDHLVSEHANPTHVPVTLLTDLEKHLRSMEDALRTVKNEAYNAQQEALDAHSKEQVSAQTTLDQVESLQKSYFDLLQSVQNQVPYRQEIQHKLDALPPLEMLYTYSMGLIRKVRQLRAQAMERQCTASRLDVELVQTQCCLLLSHAQIERQKLQLGAASSKKACVQRCHSYHGQDLIDRLVNVNLNFFLPFKLHGSRSSKVLESNRQSMFEPLLDPEPSEAELLRMFERMTTRSAVTYDDVSQENLSPQRVYESPQLSHRLESRQSNHQSQAQQAAHQNVHQPTMHTSHGHTIDAQTRRPSQLDSPLSRMRNARRQNARPVSMIENPVQTPPSIRKPYTPKFDSRRMTPVVQHHKHEGDVIRSVGPYPSASSNTRLSNMGQVRALTAVFEPGHEPHRHESRPPSRISQMDDSIQFNQSAQPLHLYRPISGTNSYGWPSSAQNGNFQPVIHRRVIMPMQQRQPMHPIDSDGSPPCSTPPWRRQSSITSNGARALSVQARSSAPNHNQGKAPTATSESSNTPSPHYESLHSSRLAATPVGDHRLQIYHHEPTAPSSIQPLQSPREAKRRQFLFAQQQHQQHQQQQQSGCGRPASSNYPNSRLPNCGNSNSNDKLTEKPLQLPVNSREQNNADKKPSWISRLTHKAKK